MKRKSVFLCSIIGLLSCASLIGCGGGKTITVWVGNESAEFYQKKAQDFLAANPEFGYKIEVVGTDSGTNGGAMVQDNTACGDIVTIAHDNIGKLSQLSYISPITDESLLAQIEADNPESFKKVVKNYLGPQTAGAKKWTFAAPYISQALFLLYDTRYVTEEQAKTFEGLEAAAAAVGGNTKAVTVTGTDGFNFSFTLLGRKLPGNTSSLALYEEEERYNAYGQSNDEVALARWAQRYFNTTNGGSLGSDSGWAVDIKNHAAVSLIGGAWHFNAFKSSVTDDQGVAHVGCALIPTLKLTEQDVAGIETTTNLYTKEADPAPVAGTEYRGGTFADCKCFVINMAADEAKYEKLCQLVKYFSSKEVQKESFLAALNVPAFVGGDEFIESVKSEIDDSVYQMAKAQTGMASYGIAQPFVNGTLNTFYYSKSAPDYYKEMIINKDGAYSEVSKVRETLFKMEYVWKHGDLPSAMPTSFPHDTTAKQ